MKTIWLVNSYGPNIDMQDEFYDYTAAGLAVVNSLKGKIREWIGKKMQE